jgi:hypothetical protein
MNNRISLVHLPLGAEHHRQGALSPLITGEKMVDFEKTKTELEKINYTNLFVDRGQNTEYMDKIRMNFNPPQNEIIIGFIDADYTQKGKDGVLITGEGIRWIYSQAKIDGKERGKGSFTFAELSNYSCSARTKLIRNSATLSKMNITDGTNLVIEMAFSYNISLDEKTNAEQVQALERVFAALASIYAADPASIPDDKNSKLIEAFIDDIEDTAIFYKRALQTIWWGTGKSGRVGGWKLQQASFMRIL